MPALGRAARGLGAAVVLLVLLIGVPMFLVGAVGWPLPRSVPAWDEITGTFNGDLPLDAATVWKVLACIVWVAWAQILAATVVESAALARGGVAAPILGLAHMQGLAGSLLGTVVLLLPGVFARPAPAHEAPSIATARTLVAHTAILESEPVALSSAADPAPPDAPTIERTVERRDTLWDLAERYLAPGGSVEEISAAVRQLFELNQGRPQADGSALTDASLLRPGWVLRIPAGTDPPSTGSTVIVVPGDSLWEIAEDHLGDGDRYPEIFDLNAGRPQPDGEALSEPAHIEPGWRLEVPPVVSAPPPAPTPTTPSPPGAPPVAPPAPTAPPTTAADMAPAPQPIPTTAPTTHGNGATPTTAAPAPGNDGPASVPGASAQEDTTTSVVGVLGVAGGLLATGLGTVLAFRRRRQLAVRRPGTEPPPIPDSAAAVLEDLADVDLDYSLGVDHALRQLGQALGTRPSVPVPIVATLDGSSIDLLLDRSDPRPPEPWRAVADGLIWRAQVEARTDELDAGPAWLPAFVSIGSLDAGGLLLNLEAVGAVAVVGEAPAIALVRSIVAELAMTPLADVAAIHVVGDVLGDVSTLPRVRHHDDLAGALAAAEEDTAVVSGALAGGGTPNAIELRCQARDEAWAPAVVVAPSTAAAPDVLTRLVDRCHERAGVVAVLIGSCTTGALEVSVSADEVTIPALGLTCAPQQLEQETLDTIDDLLDLTDEVCVEPSDESPLTLFTPTELGDTNEGSDAEPTLHLHLLGSVQLEGTEISPQQLSIVAYLAVHPDATADAVRDAIWGGKTPTRERFLNTMHELRRVVGVDVLPSSTDGRYRLRRVWCDLVEVERLVAAAKANPEDRGMHLRAVLELVGGPPLTFESRHRRHFTWVDLGNHASRWERIVGDAAHDLAQLALDEGDADLARWAAERGLLASPASQTLTCDLISAHLAAGDRNAAEHVVDAYGRVLEDLGYDDTPEELQELLEARRAS